MGNQEQALDNVYKSLTFPVSYYAFPRQRMRNLYFTTNLLYRFKYYESAAEYAQAMVDLTENQLQDRWMSQVGRNQLAASLGGLKRYPEALETAGQSMRIAETITDEGLKKRLTITSLLTMARVQRQSGDCSAAIDNYEKAVEILKGMESVMDKYDTLSGRFQCEVAEKDDEAIKTSMPEILEFLDANRQKIKQEADRYIFFDGEQVVYDAAVGYIFSDRHDPPAAFDYAETSRARSLLSLVVREGEPPAPLPLGEIRSRMPAEVQMVYYAVLKDKLLIWYISNSKLESFELDTGADEIENKVAAYVETLRSADNNVAKEAGKELYLLLIKPIEALLEKDKTICFIADKSLFRIPFAAIVSPDDRYLIEDYPILQAPSASIFVRLTEDAARKNTGGEESVLSIGNPAFSQGEYPELKDLPDAIKEAETVASYYTGAKLHTGKNALTKTILEELPNTDVFHFAGHYVPNLRWPKLSKLVLTDDLTVQEIMDNSLSRPRLIVLSGCETGVEKFYNGEGMIGAARAFLASDVPVVVATQWPVDSASAARLMARFHFYRKKQGNNVTAALRNAQLEMLRDDGPRFSKPYYWAGFTTIGGYSGY
jgi:CHAT domain-containing protein